MAIGARVGGKTARRQPEGGGRSAFFGRYVPCGSFQFDPHQLAQELIGKTSCLVHQGTAAHHDRVENESKLALQRGRVGEAGG